MALQPPAVRRNNASATNSGAASNIGGGVLNWLQPDPSMYQPDQVVYKTVNNAANGTAAGNNGNALPNNGTFQEWSLSLDGWTLTAGDDRITNSKQVVASVEVLYTELYFPQDQTRLIRMPAFQCTLLVSHSFTITYSRCCYSRFSATSEHGIPWCCFASLDHPL